MEPYYLGCFQTVDTRKRNSGLGLTKYLESCDIPIAGIRNYPYNSNNGMATVINILVTFWHKIQE